MKTAVIVYHRKPHRIYRSSWLTKFVDSICSQTYPEFDIIELDYDGDGTRLFSDAATPSHRAIFMSQPMYSFVEAANFLLDYCRDKGYEAVFNTHVDDYYERNRIEIQLPYLENFDLVSANFTAVNEFDTGFFFYQFHERDIAAEMAAGHNMICNPVAVFGRKWLESDLRFQPELAPFEDMDLWKRGLAENMKFVIAPEFLCYHRSHDNEASRSDNR